jgi:hypothetical protein
LTTTADYERVCGQARRDLTTGHVLWTGAVTGSGAPRTSLNGRNIDARRIVWSHINGGELPAYTRLRSLCGEQLCIADACVSYVGDGLADEDFISWACTCGNSVRVLPLASAAWCSGPPGKAHAAQRMSRSSNSR